MVRSKRSAEKEAFWRRVLEEYRRSGASVRGFCRRKELSESSFYAWRKEIMKRDEAHGADASPVADEARVANEARVATSRRQRLIPVNVVAASGDCTPRGERAAALLEVVTPSGFTLRFHSDMAPQQLEALLRVIAGCQNGAAPC